MSLTTIAFVMTSAATGIDPATSAAIAAGAALLGFCLATARDQLRERRERQHRQRVTLRNLSREMSNNHKACSSNLTMLAVEKRELEARKSMGHVNPLDRLEEGAWSLAYLDLPARLIEDEDLLGRLEVLVGITRRVNNTIQSRENFQIQHLSKDADFYFSAMISYEELLGHLQKDLLQRIDLASYELSPFVTTKSWLERLWLQIKRPAEGKA